MPLVSPTIDRLIQTKYSIPKINENIISRPHLGIKLDSSLNRKLTLITAPSGYGKTTTVLQWIEESNITATWLSIDPSDNNPFMFWKYVCASLNTVIPDLLNDTEYILSSYDLVNANIQINIIIDYMIKLNHDLVFIIDDIHLIDNSSILSGLTHLIDYLPSNVHLILIGRTYPDTLISKHSVKSKLDTITVADLRFKEREISQFYETQGYILESCDIETVKNYTEGWVAALVAIAMSITDISESHHVISKFAQRTIEQYIVDEILNTWPTEKKMFLLKTSVLETLSEDSCNFLLGIDNSIKILNEICQRNEFTICLAEDNSIYRYHHLFKDTLYNVLKNKYPTELISMHNKAANWYLDKGLPSQAIAHYLKAKNYDSAYKLLDQQLLNHLITIPDFRTGFLWINQLPSLYIENSIKITCFTAVYHAHKYDFRRSHEVMSRINHIQESNLSRDIKSDHIVLVLTSIFLMLAEGKIQDLSSLMMSFETDKPIIKYFNFNERDIFFYRTFINLWSRLFGENHKLFLEITNSFSRVSSCEAGYTPLSSGEYYYENDQLNDAMPYLVEAMNRGLSVNCPGTLVPSMVNIARIRRANGNLSNAIQILDECEEKLKYINQIHWNYLVESYKTRLYLEMENTEKVDEWLNKTKLTIYSDINTINEFQLIVYSRILIKTACADDAELLLLRLLAYTESCMRLHSKVEILNLLSILYYKNNDLPKSLGYIKKSLSIGLTEGYIRSYVDELDSIIDILRLTINDSTKNVNGYDDDMKAYIKNLFTLTKNNIRMVSSSNISIKNKDTTTLLTPKEREVLKLLLDAHTNEEICLKLNISLRTVKAHTGNIYSKLGVKNRAQCVKLIHETNLLE